MVQSPEKKAICLAAAVVSQTPEAFMLAAAVAEARRVLESRVNVLRGNEDADIVRSIEEVLAEIPVESVIEADIPG